MKKKHYSMEFKLAALQRLEEGESAEAVAKDLKLSTSSLLYKWKQSRVPKRLMKRALTPPDTRERDAIVYLKHAKLAMTEELRKGTVKQLSKSNLLSLLALETLISDD